MRVGDLFLGDRFDTESVHNLSGAVFAFAITVLILDLVVPEIPRGAPERVLLSALVKLWPHMAAYVVTFGLIASFWVSHRRVFSFIRAADRLFLWLNLFFLMGIAFLPFTTKLMGTYPRYRVGLWAYAGTAMGTLLIQYVQWMYAIRRGFVHPDLNPEWTRRISRRIQLGFLIGLLSVGLSFFDPLVSLFIFISMPLLAMWPVHLDVPAQGPQDHVSESM